MAPIRQRPSLRAAATGPSLAITPRGGPLDLVSRLRLNACHFRGWHCPAVLTPAVAIVRPGLLVLPRGGLGRLECVTVVRRAGGELVWRRADHWELGVARQRRDVAVVIAAIAGAADASEVDVLLAASTPTSTSPDG